MAQDFAKKNRPPRRGATRVQEPPEPTPRTRQLPNWAWLLAGLVAGFALAQLFNEPAPTPLASTPVQLPTATAPEATPAIEERSTAAAQASIASPETEAEPEATAPAKPRFDFYTLLPETEVIAPKVDAYKSTPKQPAGSADSGVATPVYMLQAGSFRAQADAERLRQRLQRMGLNAKVSAVTSRNGEVWHRVQTGPFDNRRDLNRAQDKLADAQIESLLIRLKP